MKARAHRTVPAGSRRRILVVDDHPLMREGIAQWISRTADLEVCGEAESAARALSLVERLKPDLVLTDLSLTGRSGVELIKDLRALRPELPVLVLSMHDELAHAGRVLQAGARGFLMKQVGGNRVVEAIRDVLRGRLVFSKEVTTLLLDQFASGRKRTGGRALSNLTDREFEVLQLLGEAKSNREIARQLNLSPKTVETHRLNLMRKLQLRNFAEVVRFALAYAAGEPAGPAKP